VFDSDNAAKLMLRGEADIALTWSGDAALLLSQSKAFQFVLPKEGAHQYVDFLAIPQGAHHQEAAEKFINFILRPDVSLMISKAIPFTNPNQVAYQQLSDEARQNAASYPPGNPHLKAHREIGEMSEQVEKLYYELRYGPVDIKRRAPRSEEKQKAGPSDENTDLPAGSVLEPTSTFRTASW
jgi:spermidine/putrescine transport system substrate-binding protein